MRKAICVVLLAGTFAMGAPVDAGVPFTEARPFDRVPSLVSARAALPALTLVLVGLLPVILLIRRSARSFG